MEYIKWKHAYMAELRAGEKEQGLGWFQKEQERLDREFSREGIRKCRIYIQEIEGRNCLFAYAEEEQDREQTKIPVFLPGYSPFSWQEARQVYEFKVHEGEDLTGLSARGIIIGVKKNYLEEYIRLHDEQPKTIHDLCYENGFRHSSIYVTELAKGGLYLLQFVECAGEENPALYENETYQEWLRVTGECQEPLPGERFWKEMRSVYEFEKRHLDIRKNIQI